MAWDGRSLDPISRGRLVVDSSLPINHHLRRTFIEGPNFRPLQDEKDVSRRDRDLGRAFHGNFCARYEDYGESSRPAVNRAS